MPHSIGFRRYEIIHNRLPTLFFYIILFFIFTGNDIGNEGAVSLAKALQVNICLTMLNLESTKSFQSLLSPTHYFIFLIKLLQTTVLVIKEQQVSQKC